MSFHKLTLRRCYNETSLTLFESTYEQGHKDCIYSQYFLLNSQFMACSFSLCSQMKYAFSFQRAIWAKSWWMTAKIAENYARTSQVDQFAVVTAWPRLGTWSIVTSRVEGTRHVCCLVSKECRITTKEKRLRWSFIPLYSCTSVVSSSCTAMNKDRLPSRRVRQGTVGKTDPTGPRSTDYPTDYSHRWP